MSGHSDQEAIYEQLLDLAEDMHELVKTLSVYPPKIAAIVINRALQGSEIRGKRKRRIRGFIVNEVKSRRIAKAAGDPVPFEEPAEPAQEAA